MFYFIESTKLLFLKRTTDIDFKSSIELKPPLPPIGSQSTQFRLTFTLHRISTPETYPNTNNFKQPTGTNLAFLLLKQTPKNPQFNYQYLVSIENDGYLTLKKLQFIEPPPSSQVDFVGRPLAPISSSNAANFKPIWTLKNERINLNDANSSYAADISIKLAEPNLVELSINRTYTVRFEVINEFMGAQIWSIDSVKFRNFNQFLYPTMNNGGAYGAYSYNALPNTNTNGFIVYDLQINGVHYILRPKAGMQMELVLLDEKLNFMESFESSVNSLGLFNRTIDDFELINGLNQNELYCDGNSVAQSSYDLLINKNRANFSLSQQATIKNR